MKFTAKIEKAIKKACLLHSGQTRRVDSNTPFVYHPFSVALILSNYTDDEDTIVAGLLHDTIEDTNYTPEEMEKDFDKNVKDIVLGVTEPKVAGDAKESWEQRKNSYLENLKTAKPESLMVSAADKIHNLFTLIENYKVYGDKVMEKFHAPIEKRLEINKKILEILKEKLDSKIVDELASIIRQAEQIFLKN